MGDDQENNEIKISRFIKVTEQHDLANEAKRFYKIKGELTVVDGLLMKGSRIVIPQSLRPDTIDKIQN